MCLYILKLKRNNERQVGHALAPSRASSSVPPQRRSSTTHLPSSNSMHVGARAQPRGGLLAQIVVRGHVGWHRLSSRMTMRARRSSWLSSSVSACLSADAGMSRRRVRRCVSATSGRGTPRRRRGYDGGELIVPARRRRRRREWREERLAGAGEVQITIHRELTVIFRDAEPSGNPIVPRGANPTRYAPSASPLSPLCLSLWPVATHPHSPWSLAAYLEP